MLEGFDAFDTMKNVVKPGTLCPVCKTGLFSEPDSQEKCPVCGWVNDEYQTQHIFVRNGANKFSLAQSKKAWNILNYEYEVGYGRDNLHWGGELCRLCGENISIDECQYKLQQLLNKKFPKGLQLMSWSKAKAHCAHCILSTHESLAELRKSTKMVEKPSGWDSYGSGEWGAGSSSYDIEKNKSYLKSLIRYCHDEAAAAASDATPKADDLDFDENKDYLLKLMAEDEKGRRNLRSYFSEPLLSIADFIEYARMESGALHENFSLWAFGGEKEEKYSFTPEEKKEAEQVLHLSLSFQNYKCDQFADPGFYYLDNVYPGWEPEEFDDAIAAWFVDMGDELDEKNVKEFIVYTLKRSFSVSRVKLALHLLANLGYAKEDSDLRRLVVLLHRAPELRPLANKCFKWYKA